MAFRMRWIIAGARSNISLEMLDPAPMGILALRSLPKPLNPPGPLFPNLKDILLIIYCWTDLGWTDLGPLSGARREGDVVADVVPPGFLGAGLGGPGVTTSVSPMGRAPYRALASECLRGD